MQIFLTIWSFVAVLGSLAALGAVWWLSPYRMNTPVRSAFLVALSAGIGAFGWGEARFADGRAAGVAAEAREWQRSFDALKADLETEKRTAEAELEKIRADFVAAKAIAAEAERESAIATARLLAEINAEPMQSTEITCEKADEKIIIPACPNPYSLRLDPRLLRSLKAARGQN